jgi:hypothetical protein
LFIGSIQFPDELEELGWQMRCAVRAARQTGISLYFIGNQWERLPKIAIFRRKTAPEMNCL